MVVKATDKRPAPAITFCTFLFFSACVMATAMKVFRRTRFTLVDFHESEGDRTFQLAENSLDEAKPEDLSFVTLCFNQTAVKPMVDHNCAFLNKLGYQFHIYTDDLTQSYCSTCSCTPFRLKNCTCPQPGRSDCSLCEKLLFMIDLTNSMSSFVFLDSDLILLKDRFIPALRARTEHFDFLAAYGFGVSQNWRYTSQFNSGLMFLRRLQSVNYSKLVDIMYDMGTNNDQNVISTFIQRYYENWDTLSLRWHCRYLYRKEHNINFTDCMTFHGRNQALSQVLNASNLQLMTTKASSSNSHRFHGVPVSVQFV